jgi:chemotaxis protein methyltransferase CheR
MGLSVAPPVPGSLDITEDEFQTIRQLVYDHFGINLSEQKRSLVIGRLQKVLRQRGFADFGTYLAWLHADRSGVALEELANRISTNHTFFWREKSHFEYFAGTVLPEAAERRRREGGRLRIWCAGCSTGEEPYTLVMLMKDTLGRDYAALEPLLLATDLSATALSTAMGAVYHEERLLQMPDRLRRPYFRKGPEAETWQVTDEIRREVVFRRHNLMNTTYPFKHAFDAVFCRNVMIYFDKPTRDALVARFHKHTVPGGHLFIGHSETLGRDGALWEYVMPAAYRRVS